MMTEELKPCPFCGRHEFFEPGEHPVDSFHVICTYCGAHGPAWSDYPRTERMWNERPIEDALRARLAAAEARADAAENARDWLIRVLDQVRDTDRMQAEIDALYALESGAPQPESGHWMHVANVAHWLAVHAPEPHHAAQE